MYQKLINVIDQRIKLEDDFNKRKTDFENSNAVLIAQLADLKEKEILLREEALLLLDKENKNSVEVDDRIIYKQVRITRLIDNVPEFIATAQGARESMETIGIKYDVTEFFSMEPVITDKKKALEIAESYLKFTGNNMGGIKNKETNFITIKTKAE